MMQEKKLKKDRLPEFIKAVSEDYTVFGPVKDRDFHHFARISPGDEIDFDYSNSRMSPKGLLFPQSEVLCRFEDDRVDEEKVPQAKTAIMLMRPCDARAVMFLDKVFGGEEFRDPYYLERREQTTVVSLACNRPLPTCFCTALGAGPADEQGSDCIIFDVGDDLIVKALTPKGEALLKPVDKLLSPVQKADTDKAKRLAEESRKQFPAGPDTDGLKEKLDGSFDAPFWDGIHQPCFGCGTCTYLCPTCYCFDITDEGSCARGRRLRSWDSCMYPLFTLHASGHNPRSSGRERMRQRVMHKFNYCPENFQDTFCVGCGRCVRQCPVNLDIRQVIEVIQSEKQAVKDAG